VVVGATAYHWAAVDTFFSKICSQNWVAILKKQKWWLSKLGCNFEKTEVIAPKTGLQF
jgi:hypothetical protein